MPKPLITDAEMAQLLTPQEGRLLTGADTGFKLRNRFLLLLVFFSQSNCCYFLSKPAAI
ncbi:MAG: hypothetical protein QMB17_11225 [Polaromonas sp.]